MVDTDRYTRGCREVGWSLVFFFFKVEGSGGGGLTAANLDCSHVLKDASRIVCPGLC